MLIHNEGVVWIGLSDVGSSRDGKIGKEREGRGWGGETDNSSSLLVVTSVLKQFEKRC